MNIRKSYWIASLSLLLSFSLVLPFCCHAETMDSPDHQREMQAHTAHGQQSDAQGCDCGHEFVKDYQKNKKVTNGQHWSLSPASEISGRPEFFAATHFARTSISIQPRMFDDSGPALHLWNSVFLN